MPTRRILTTATQTTTTTTTTPVGGAYLEAEGVGEEDLVGGGQGQEGPGRVGASHGPTLGWHEGHRVDLRAHTQQRTEAGGPQQTGYRGSQRAETQRLQARGRCCTCTAFMCHGKMCTHNTEQETAVHNGLGRVRVAVWRACSSVHTHTGAAWLPGARTRPTLSANSRAGEKSAHPKLPHTKALLGTRCQHM